MLPTKPEAVLFSENVRATAAQRRQEEWRAPELKNASMPHRRRTDRLETSEGVINGDFRLKKNLLSFLPVAANHNRLFRLMTLKQRTSCQDLADSSKEDVLFCQELQTI